MNTTILAGNLTPNPGGITESRINWDEYGLELAKTVALRADCTRRKVGAVLMMPDHSIAATGYNGGSAGGPSCLKGQCPRGTLSTEELPSNSDYSSGKGTCIALHAEWNVLLRASWEQMNGSTLYVTTEPCHLCWNLIRGTHIERVVWRDADGVGIWSANPKEIDAESLKRLTS